MGAVEIGESILKGACALIRKVQHGSLVEQKLSAVTCAKRTSIREIDLFLRPGAKLPHASQHFSKIAKDAHPASGARIPMLRVEIR